jgi:hypothetical protein
MSGRRRQAARRAALCRGFAGYRDISVKSSALHWYGVAEREGFGRDGLSQKRRRTGKFPILGVEPRRQRVRADKIAENELPPLGIGLKGARYRSQHRR